MPTARVDEIGQGRVWAGATARKLGLVDHMGGLDVAVAEAARRAGLDPAKARAIYIEKSPALPFQILDDLLMETMPAPKHTCPGGGIGRRAGFRCQWPQGRDGSSPFLGTLCSSRRPATRRVGKK